MMTRCSQMLCLTCIAESITITDGRVVVVLELAWQWAGATAGAIFASAVAAATAVAVATLCSAIGEAASASFTADLSRG